MLISPKPQKIEFLDGIFESKNIDSINLGVFKNELEFACLELFPNIVLKDASLVKVHQEKLTEDSYKLSIRDNKIDIYAGSAVGAFYAISYLLSLTKESTIHNRLIYDYPDLKTRGIMLDISRTKVPSLKTLKEYVKLLALMRYNHLELYIEGFSYEYDSYKEYIDKNKNYITKQDVKELEAYANKFFIDLVPNENGFGHMTDWLKEPKFHDLAICPDGFFVWGSNRPAGTLNPLDDRSIEFVKTLYKDMLPNFKSKYFNMNFDEPLELGMQKTKDACEQSSKEDVFIDYFLKLYEDVKKYNKTPLIWADVLIHNPEKISRLPKDVILIDWAYHSAYDFESHAANLEKLNARYLLAPGTSSWMSITGRKQDAFDTIYNSCLAAKAHKGDGILLTDWGDSGHLQYPVISVEPVIYCGAMMWSSIERDEVDILTDTFLEEKDISKILNALGEYVSLEGEYREYGTRLMSLILWATFAFNYDDPVTFYKEKIKTNFINHENVLKLRTLFKEQLENIKHIKNDLLKEELSNSVLLLNTLLSINEKMSIDFDNSYEEEINLLHIYLDVHKKVWDARNIKSGFNLSSNFVLNLINILTRLTRKETL